jgi:hypothetical protein
MGPNDMTNIKAIHRACVNTGRHMIDTTLPCIFDESIVIPARFPKDCFLWGTTAPHFLVRGYAKETSSSRKGLRKIQSL